MIKTESNYIIQDKTVTSNDKKTNTPKTCLVLRFMVTSSEDEVHRLASYTGLWNVFV